MLSFGGGDLICKLGGDDNNGEHGSGLREEEED